MTQNTNTPASGWSDKPIALPELLSRIDSAIKRITSGSCSMRVPAESDDPDLVLADCKTLLKALAWTEDQRQRVGEAVTNKLAEMTGEGGSSPDWFDGRNVDEVLDVMQAQLPRPPDLEELRRALCAIGVVGNVDGDEVIFRASVLDIVDRRRAQAEGR